MSKPDGEGGLVVFDVLLLGAWFLILLMGLARTHSETQSRFDSLEAQIEELHR